MIKLGLITGNLKRNKTGIGTYTFQLIENIQNDTKITLIKHPDGDDVPDCPSIVSTLPSREFSHILWSQALILKRKDLQKFDLIHNPAQYPVSPKINKKYIITIHDLIPILYPEYVGNIYSLQAKLFYPIAMKSASKIITDSYHTKKDIIKLYRIPDKKIEVIYPGVSDHFSPASNEEKLRVRNKFNLNIPFILFIGAIEPKKNLELLLKAFYLCQKEKSNLHLVIAGKKAWKYQTVFAQIEQLNLGEKIRFLDFIPYEDLPALYSSAEVFVFPSRYEGFGLPPLEAMKCGTPVITSNISSLPEIVGEEGMMVSPDDHEELAESILKILSDQQLRSELSSYGLKRAALFSWRNTGQKTLEVYNTVLEDGI